MTVCSLLFLDLGTYGEIEGRVYVDIWQDFLHFK